MVPLVVLLVAAVAASVNADGHLVAGGYSPYTPAPNDENLLKAMQLAEGYLMNRHQMLSGFTATKLVQAWSQVVAGTNYRFDIELTGPMGHVKTVCNVTAFQALPQGGRVLPLEHTGTTCAIDRLVPKPWKMTPMGGCFPVHPEMPDVYVETASQMARAQLDATCDCGDFDMTNLFYACKTTLQNNINHRYIIEMSANGGRTQAVCDVYMMEMIGMETNTGSNQMMNLGITKAACTLGGEMSGPKAAAVTVQAGAGAVATSLVLAVLNVVF